MAVAEAVIASPKIPDQGLNAHLLRVAARTFGVAAVIAIVLYVSNQLGAPLYGLVAGLGVGGIAIALAAKSTLENFIGGLTLFADKPFRIGDWVVVGDKEGTVENIGIRSTRIRTFYDSRLSIPNGEIVAMTIDNMGMRTYRRVYTNVGIRYDTPPERIEALLEGIKRVIQANPNTRKDYFHVVLHDFGPDSLVVMLYFFVKVPDWSAELVERQRVFLEIVRLADAIGVEFAFPTQTLQIETFPGQPGRKPQPAASDDELRNIAAGFGSTGASAKPGGLGIFVPPHEERASK
jgi:MscS family membrane protein